MRPHPQFKKENSENQGIWRIWTTFFHISKCFMKSLRFILQGEGSLVIALIRFEKIGDLFSVLVGNRCWGLGARRCIWSLTSLQSWYWGKLWGIYLYRFHATSDDWRLFSGLRLLGRDWKQSLKRCDRFLKDFSSTRLVIWSVGFVCYFCCPMIWCCLRIRTPWTLEEQSTWQKYKNQMPTCLVWKAAEIAQQLCAGADYVRVGMKLWHVSGQIIATSDDLTPNGGLVREFLYFREI